MMLKEHKKDGVKIILRHLCILEIFLHRFYVPFIDSADFCALSESLLFGKKKIHKLYRGFWAV